MVLLSVWKNQQRFIQCEGHVHPVILAASKSSPQGCPCVPAMLALWMSSGLRFLEVSFGRLPGQVCVYVDDRTFTARSWSSMDSQIQAWQLFSDTIGLRESRNKTQVTARGCNNKRILEANCNPAWIQDEVKFLGLSSVSKPRSNTPSETKRIKTAFSRAALLSCAGLQWRRLILAFRSFVTSKLIYGWVARVPPAQQLNRLFTVLSKALRTNRNASPWIRKMFYGAQVDFSCVHLTSLWVRMTKIIQSHGRPAWVRKAHTSLHLLRQRLRKMGWCEASEYLWKRPPMWQAVLRSENQTLDLRPQGAQPLELQIHNIRLSYKHCCFQKFLTQNRRENREWFTQSSTPDLLRAFAAVDLTATWHKLQCTNGAGRAVLLGSFRSPLCNHRSDPTVSFSCLHCGCPAANHDHLFWRCPVMTPPDFHPPRNLLQRRFGWFVASPNDDYTPLEIFVHMQSVVSLTWEILFDNG